MNYLAHVFLADGTPESVVGNLMGDFAKGDITGRYTPAIRQGIMLHRRIDYFTDTHQAFLRTRARFRFTRRRYTGIISDVFYDHFLARLWQEYSTVPLRSFVDNVYSILDGYTSQAEGNFLRSINYIIANDLLYSYQAVGGIEKALQGISHKMTRRLKLETPVQLSIADLTDNYDALEADFRELFAEALVFVKESKVSTPS